MKGYIEGVPRRRENWCHTPTIGRKQTLDFSGTLLQYLKDNDGVCPLGDKSDAEDIKRQFQVVSKKTYKKQLETCTKETHHNKREWNQTNLTLQYLIYKKDKPYI